MYYVFVHYIDGDLDYFPNVKISYGDDGSLMLSNAKDPKVYDWIPLMVVKRVQVDTEPYEFAEVEEEDDASS